jgi:glutathione S-transferase
MSTYKLHYFNGRGYAEASRLILTAAGQKFEDIRYERGSDEWTARKPEMPLGQVPVLEFNGAKLPQSKTIARFLAKQFQLAGKDNFEQAKVDAVVDTIYDLVAALLPSRIEKDEVKKQELTKKFMDEDLPKHLKNLETLGKLYGDGGPYFVGKQLTWADLLFYDFGQTFLEMDGNCLNNYAWLQKNRAEVEKQPKIAEYLKNRPKTSF